MAKKNDKAREFFDRNYTKREAYVRAWKYIRPYRFRIFIGILCGMLTAGTLVPLFQIIQPTVSRLEMVGKVESVIAEVENAEAPASEAANKTAMANPAHKGLPSWYPKVEKFAAKCGFSLLDEKGAISGSLLILALFVVPVIALVRLALKFLNSYCLAWAGAHAVADLSCDMLRHVQKQSLQFFGRVNVGQLMSRITGDPQEIRTIIQIVIAELSVAPFEILISAGFIVWFAIVNKMLPTLVIISVAFPVFMTISRVVGRRMQEWTRTSLYRGSAVLGRVHEVLTCIRLVKSANAEAEECALYREANRQLVKSSMRAVRVGALVAPAIELVGVGLLCAFFGWCFSADITLQQLLPMMAPLLVVYKPVKKLSKLQVQIENTMAALNRLFSLMDVNMELPEKPDAVSKKSFTDCIRFENVSFRYDTAERDAVKNASFDIPCGQVVAVVGGTGSGKTTMSALLARFLDPTSGRVTIDGIDIRDLKSDDVRSLIGVVTQETVLFNDSVEENIKYGTPSADRAHIESAAALANAAAFIEAHPEGYSRFVGEKGFALSGGERQRLVIARALVKNPPILILDEATSALDTVTERQVQGALDNLMKNRTSFVIAHRLSTIRNADMILVMQNGEIVERGTHEELIQLGGEYKKLCDMQSAD